jgi:hypothetical protein
MSSGLLRDSEVRMVDPAGVNAWLSDEPVSTCVAVNPRAGPGRDASGWIPGHCLDRRPPLHHRRCRPAA